MTQYLLTPHTYICITDDHAVLLDLKRDKYVGISRAQMRALAAAVKGWPPAGSPAPEDTPPPSDPVLSKMQQAGMLTTDAAIGKEAQPLALPRPESTLMEGDLDARPRIRLRHAIGFFHAAVLAAVALRVQRIEGVVARVRARKAARGAVDGADIAAARELVTAYVHLRPLLFAARDACLFDSLVLIEFLARYRVFPTWVFGVETGPFSAHCWVQEGTMVFNDTPEHVRRYTPILAV